MSWKTVLYKYNPAVPRNWLLILAGMLWTAVGSFLCFRAFIWLNALHESGTPLYVASGAVVAVAGSRFMFSKTALRNVHRIARLPERACVFAFTAWKGYLMIGGMIALGLFLRNSSLPKQYLAVLYAAMGGALLLSSFVFYRSYFDTAKH